RLPWVGTAADVFVQMQFPLHSGRIAGLPGRILISLMGLVVAALSVTGVVIWWRKRRARIGARGTMRAHPESRLAPAE
ncbi:PepSY domain-containing protein, partial [Bradyrhizobium elkanii]|uniref:PepSY domain-containing protein n=3 Tax=Nitrobacteraceae TaxID=41294 RepID=UPI000571A38F